MKSAIAAAALSVLALPALAADLGGNAIPDLEERIAELEATTARKSNRKVTLVISGQVSKALMWHDIEGLNGDGKARVIDNANSPSVIRMEGAAKFANGMSAGFLYEFGIDSTAGKGLGVAVDDISLRHAAAWLETMAGRVTIGKTSTATDGIAEITVANTAIASRMMSLDPLWTYSGLQTIGSGILNPVAFDGGRLEILRYDSPTLAGFRMSAAWGGGESQTGGDMWDVAIRYSGEFSGFRVAAGVGYRQEEINVLDVTDIKTMTGSASAMHMGTGLFVNIAAGRQEGRLLWGDVDMWHAQLGVERNFTGWGATTFYAEHGNHSFDRVIFGTNYGADSKFWGAGIVQAIDGAAMDVFMSYRRYDVGAISNTTTEGTDAQQIMVGTRIRF